MKNGRKNLSKKYDFRFQDFKYFIYLDLIVKKFEKILFNKKMKKNKKLLKKYKDKKKIIYHQHKLKLMNLKNK